jgi:hypothetical protein
MMRRTGDVIAMTNDDHNVSADELESASGEPLPDRQAMTILPIDPASGGPFPFPLPVEPGAEGGGGETLPVEPPAES